MKKNNKNLTNKKNNKICDKSHLKLNSKSNTNVCNNYCNKNDDDECNDLDCNEME